MSDYKNEDEDKDKEAGEDKEVLYSIFKLSDAQRALFENDLSSFFMFTDAQRALFENDLSSFFMFTDAQRALYENDLASLFTFTDLQRAIYRNDIASLFMFTDAQRATDENELASPYLFPYSQIPLLENNRWAPKPIYENEPALASTVVDVGRALYGERYDLYPMPMGRIENGQNYFNPSENKKTSDVNANIDKFSFITHFTTAGGIILNVLDEIGKIPKPLKKVIPVVSLIDGFASLFFLGNKLELITNNKNLSDYEKARESGIAIGATLGGLGGARFGILAYLLGMDFLGKVGGEVAGFGYLYNQILSKDDSSQLSSWQKHLMTFVLTNYIRSQEGIATDGILLEDSGQTQTDKVSPWLDLRDPFAEFYDGLTYKNLYSELSPSMMMLLDVHNSRSNSGSIIDVIDALEKSSIQAETDKYVSPWIKLLTDLNFLKPVPNGTDNTDSLSKTPITRDSAHETETAPPPITGDSTAIISKVSGDAPRGNLQLLRSGVFLS